MSKYSLTYLGENPMSAEENRVIVQRWIEEVWNKGNLAVADEIVAVNYANYDPVGPMLEPGRSGLKKLVALYRIAFPDLQFTIEDIVSEGNKVVTRWKAHGTHKGDLMGIPATGNEATTVGISINRILNGEIVEHRTNWDVLGLMQQLGVMRPLARSAISSISRLRSTSL
jgi:steroid delta-isomerase-like uncharacterized protein